MPNPIPRRRNAAVTREAILLSARKAFAQSGYDGAGVREIAAGAGVTAMLVNRYFGSKEQLFSEVVRLYIATHGQVMDHLRDTALPPRQALELALLHSARMQTDAAHPSGCMLVLSTSLCPPHNRALQAQLQAERERTRTGLLNCVQRAVDTGDLPRTVDPVVLATTIDTFLQGMTAMARQGVALATLEASIGQLLSIWDNLSAA